VYIERRNKLYEKLEDRSILVLFSGNPPHKTEDMEYHYTPNRNFLYLTGIARSGMILFATKHGGQVSETLFIEKADPLLEKWVGRKLRADEATRISGIEKVLYVEDFVAQLGRHLWRQGASAAYLDLGRVSWKQPLSLAHEFAAELRQKHPDIRIHNVHPEVTRLRLIKSEEEVDYIRKAIEITKLGIENLLANAKPGAMEYELEAHFAYKLHMSGVREPGFGTIVASGKNAVILHYEENNAQTKDGDLVLLDLGAQYNYYSADISRTFPVNGKFTDRQKQLYDIVLNVELAVIEAVKPGVTWKQLNDLAKRMLADELKKIGLIKEDGELSRYYYHSVGHQLGLNVHDVTVLGENDPLQPGMVITIEPGLYIEEESIGIRIEDDILVTETGAENLSKDILKTTEEIEAFMANAR
jgi:Xaa-Pro aminopeptidase